MNVAISIGIALSIESAALTARVIAGRVDIEAIRIKPLHVALQTISDAPEHARVAHDAKWNPVARGQRRCRARVPEVLGI